MAIPSIMHTASEGSTVRISTILFTGTVGITIPICMIRTIHGIHLHGQCRGEWDGDIAGTHLTTVGGMVTLPTTATEWGIPITVRGTDTVVVTTEVLTTAAGMPILITTAMAEDHQAPPMYVTETGQTGIWTEHRHAHLPQKVCVKEMQEELLPKDRMLTAEVHRAQA